jgi:uncharacterized protein YecT (DUF1311 family)
MKLYDQSLKKKLPAKEWGVLQEAQKTWIVFRDAQIKSNVTTYAG